MTLIVPQNNPLSLSKVVTTIQQGGIVCVPTETVYGLICSTCNKEAVDRIYSIKGRPANKPFALFASSWDRMKAEAVETPSAAEILSSRFWPGPLTLVITARDECPGSYNHSVGVRCPGHEFVLRVLTECGGLLINTSLNRSGEPEICSLEEAGRLLNDIDLVVDGGMLPKSKPSSVVDCRCDPPVLLREGAIEEETIRRALSE